jgi:hypothetical protein
MAAAAGKIPTCARRSSRGMSKKRWWTTVWHSLAEDTEAAAAGWGRRLGRERGKALEGRRRLVGGAARWSGGAHGGVDGEEGGGGSDSRLREVRTGWRRQQSRGGEQAPRGKRGG